MKNTAQKTPALRIVHIITGLSTGGAEVMLHKLISTLPPEQFDNRVISLTDAGPLAAPIRACGIPVMALGMRRGLPDPIRLLKLAWVLKKMRPDIVQTWMYHADLIGGLAAKLAGVPVIVWNIRHSNLDKNLNKLGTRLVAKACARLSRSIPQTIICNSQRAMKVHQQTGYDSSRFQYIGNGFDVNQFQPDGGAKARFCKQLGLKPEYSLVGLIARYDPLKDHQTFIRAARRMLQNQPDIRFILAGTNIDTNNLELRNKIAQTGHPEHFCLLGERKDTPFILAALDILCLSSAGESFPNVIGEAMACGVPCVATDVGDSALIVGNTGKIVPPANPFALSAVALELLALSPDARKQRGLQARQRIIEHFSLPVIAGQYQSLYQRLKN